MNASECIFFGRRFYVGGPSTGFWVEVEHQHLIEQMIAEACSINGDDPSDYTSTLFDGCQPTPTKGPTP